MFDSRFQEFKGKFHTRWLGPYTIDQDFDNGVVQLTPIDGERGTMLVNGHGLKLYHKLASREEFLSKLQSKVEHFIMEDITSLMELNYK